MLYRTYEPPAPLDRFIENFWYWEGTPLPHQKELIMASPLVGLLVKLDDLVAEGQAVAVIAN